MNLYLAGYWACYWTHVACVAISGGFFFLRGVWMLRGSPLLRRKFVRIAPHVNDTALLLAAIGLAVITGQYPFTHDWLTIKFALLLAYIGLGMVALRGRGKNMRLAAFVLSLAVFAAMVAVALFRGRMT